MLRSSSISYLSLILCLLFFTSLCHSVTTNESRLKQLTQLRKSARRGLISFNTETFETFIEASPRTYGVLILFTASPQICQVCNPMTKLFKPVSAEYYSQSSKRSAPNPLFFAELKLSQDDQPFLVKYHIQHVPILYYFPPARNKFTQPLQESSPNNYPIQRVGIGSNAIREFVNARTGSRLKLVQGNYKIPFVQTVRKFKGAILLMVAILAAISVKTGAYKIPMFWFGVVVLVYIFSVGGGHYSWINNVPLAVVNKEGITEYIASGSRSQYVAEGFFVSATCVSISVLIILIQELPSVMPNKEVQTLAGAVLFVMTIIAITVLLAMYHLVSMSIYLLLLLAIMVSDNTHANARSSSR